VQEKPRQTKTCTNNAFNHSDTILNYEGMTKRLPLYVADVEGAEDGILSLSIVKQPASGLKWKVLSEDSEGMTVFAPILPANKPIFREHEGLQYNCIFLPDVIKDALERYAARRPRFDVEHNGLNVDGVRILQSFQIDYRTRTFFDDYFGLTDGTWVMVLWLPNVLRNKWDSRYTIDEAGNMVFNDKASGFTPQNFSGISISGVFTYHEVGLQEAIQMYNDLRIQ